MMPRKAHINPVSGSVKSPSPTWLSHPLSPENLRWKELDENDTIDNCSNQAKTRQLAWLWDRSSYWKTEFLFVLRTYSLLQRTSTSVQLDSVTSEEKDCHTIDYQQATWSLCGSKAFSFSNHLDFYNPRLQVTNTISQAIAENGFLRSFFVNSLDRKGREENKS